MSSAGNSDVIPIRLQVFLARAGVCSRRKAESLITSGQVRVNKQVVTRLGEKVTPGVDRILVGDKEVSIESKRLFLFHKPKNVVTTMSDPQGRPCVGDYVKDVPYRLFPIGRLDRDVRGLLILTNDGAFAEELSHPRYQVPRVYWALVEGAPSSETLNTLCTGVELEWGQCKAAAARVLEEKAELLRAWSLVGTHFASENSRENYSFLELTVTSGKKHFVKKLLAAVGYPVEVLTRTSFGDYALGNIKPGEMVDISD